MYAIGSIITAGCQDCTIWGSGCLNTTILSRLRSRKLDVRAVRGPLTRMVLMEHGYAVPEIYGDPAILMPLIFDPEVEKKYKVSIIPHMNEQEQYRQSACHFIDIRTVDYKKPIREIKESELILSSSLHGIILAEAYGVPAILLKPQVGMFKYMDYYYGTGRLEFPIAESVEEALTFAPPCIPDFAGMQEKLLTAFPIDLWQ